MSQYSSWVVEFSLEIHASVSLHMHIGNAMLHNSSPALWINPSLIVCLFVCSLSSHSLDCISCSYEEMGDAPVGTTSWSPAKKRNGFEEVDVFGRPRGYRHNALYKHQLCILEMVYLFPSKINGVSPSIVMVKELDCSLQVTEFELQTYYYVHFRTNTLGKGIKPLVPHPTTSYALYRITAFLLLGCL